MKLPSGLEREIGTTNDSWGGGTGYSWDVSEPSPELQFPLSTAVYDRMRRQDAQCAAVLRAITLPIRRSQWHIDPNGARDEVVQHVSEDLGLPILGVEQSGSLPRLRGRFSWDEHLRQALLCLPYGFMPFEQVYRIEGDRARLAKLAPRMPATIVHIETNRGGGLDWIEQHATSAKIPVERLVMYVNDREGGSWTGTSVLRGAYKHWLLKDKLLRLANMTIERNGMGIPTVEAPPGATPSQVRDLDKLAQSYRAGESSGGSVPHGARLRLVGVEGTIPDPLPLIRYHDEAIARNVLAQFLNLGTTQSGARALGESFIDFFQLALDAVAQGIAATATQHIVEDLVDLNFGETERAPRIGVTASDAETDLSVEALVQLVDGGVIQPDDELETYARARYRLPDKGDARSSATPPTQVVNNLAARASARRRRTPKTATPSVDTSDPEGPWLVLLPRRDELTARNRVTFAAAVTDFAATVATGPIIDAAYGVVQAAADPSDAAVVGAAGAALETALATPTGQHLRVVGHDAIVSGYAEGQVDAEALIEWAADGQISLDFAVAFDEAVKAAGNLDELWSAADDWLAEHVGATSRMIGDAVRTALVDGATRSELLDAITAVLKDAEQAAVLYDNAVATALSVGALDKYDAVGLASVDFVTAGDARVDDHCATAEGANPYLINDAPVPPLHIGCFPAGTRVSGPPLLGSTTRWYAGQLVEVETVGGRRLAGTPNHPVLTAQGWVALDTLSEGDDLVCQVLGQRGVPGYPSDNDSPALIEDVAESVGGALRVSAVTVPVAAEHFHGDGAGSEVCVVRTNGLLQHDGSATGLDPTRELALPVGGVGEQPLPPLSHAARLIEGTGAPARSIVGSGDVAGVLLRSATGDTEPVGRGLVAQGDTLLAESALDDLATDLGLAGQDVDGFSGEVAAGEFLSGERDAVRPDDTARVQLAHETPTADAVPLAYDLAAFAGDVLRDRVLKVTRSDWSGHVFNLHTETGWYVANGIVVHNCRCNVSPSADGIAALS